MAHEIVPIRRRHVPGFHGVLDGVAREGRYLAMLEAPPLARVRRFVLDGLRTGRPQFVALDDEQVVGWCDVSRKEPEALRHSGVLGMGVARSHRGRGIGRDLLAATLESAKDCGIRRVELVVRVDNAAAIALYRRFGFVEEGRSRRYLCVHGRYDDALHMARLD